MKIEKYLEKNNIGIPTAARALGVSRQWMHKLITKKIPAGRTLAMRIANLTDGEVSILEAMRIELPAQPPASPDKPV